SFSVHNPTSGLGYKGHSPTSPFAPRRNILKPALWGLPSGSVRFHPPARLGLTAAPGPRAPLGRLPPPPP
ncbi:hypothetical protein Q8G09_27720, partial [Klebsiella pneumoniae]|nr:hypothetical protein [Klebsiella pneumoniae]